MSHGRSTTFSQGLFVTTMCVCTMRRPRTCWLTGTTRTTSSLRPSKTHTPILFLDNLTNPHRYNMFLKVVWSVAEKGWMDGWKWSQVFSLRYNKSCNVVNIGVWMLEEQLEKSSSTRMWTERRQVESAGSARWFSPVSYYCKATLAAYCFNLAEQNLQVCDGPIFCWFVFFC